MQQPDRKGGLIEMGKTGSMVNNGFEHLKLDSVSDFAFRISDLFPRSAFRIPRSRIVP
jgi:hypothetical protein